MLQLPNLLVDEGRHTGKTIVQDRGDVVCRILCRLLYFGVT